MDSEHVKVHNASDKFLDLEPTPTEMGLNKSCLQNKILILICLLKLIYFRRPLFPKDKKNKFENALLCSSTVTEGTNSVCVSYCQHPSGFS